MQLSARGAQKTRDESKKLNMYSKQWLPGDTLRVYYPLFWDNGQPEIAVGAVWGHDVGNIKELGLKAAFIPSTTEFDENKLPIGTPDITYQFSLIAPLFVNAMKLQEESVIAAKPFPTEAGRKDALNAIALKYDTKNNIEAVKPIIGKVKYFISTEVISVKLVNDVPAADTIAITSAPLSGQTIQRLYTIMSDPKYAPKEGDKYLEVEWRYPTDPKKSNSAKAAAPAGVTQEYKLCTTNPSAWNQIEGMLSNLATDSQTIARRATRAINPDKVRQALTQYCIMNSEFLDLVGEEDEETLLRNVDVIKELDVVQSLKNTELVAKIEEALREAEAAAAIPNLSAELPTANPADASAFVPQNTSGEVEQADNQLSNGGVTGEVNLQNPNSGVGQSAATIQELLGNDSKVDGDVELLDLGGLV